MNVANWNGLLFFYILLVLLAIAIGIIVLLAKKK